MITAGFALRIFQLIDHKHIKFALGTFVKDNALDLRLKSSNWSIINALNLRLKSSNWSIIKGNALDLLLESSNSVSSAELALRVCQFGIMGFSSITPETEETIAFEYDRPGFDLETV